MNVTNRIDLELPDSTKVTLTEEEAEDLFEKLRRVLKKDYPIPYLVPAPITPIWPTTDLPSYPSYPTITCGGT